MLALPQTEVFDAMARDYAQSGAKGAPRFLGQQGGKDKTNRLHSTRQLRHAATASSKLNGDSLSLQYEPYKSPALFSKTREE